MSALPMPGLQGRHGKMCQYCGAWSLPAHPRPTAASHGCNSRLGCVADTLCCPDCIVNTPCIFNALPTSSPVLPQPGELEKRLRGEYQPSDRQASRVGFAALTGGTAGRQASCPAFKGYALESLNVAYRMRAHALHCAPLCSLPSLVQRGGGDERGRPAAVGD